ncbi:MAG: hypothetical protein EOP34_06050 [Rickettsiales bacterium]|nr:MAG: hypothetical protein EOP34_06050 [Rickettsiales bacterium]
MVFSSKINYSLSKIAVTIRYSVILRTTLLLLSSSLAYFEFDVDNIIGVFGMLIIGLLIVSFLTAENKSQFLFNLGVILLFWSLARGLTSLSFGATFLPSFLLYYQDVLFIEGVITPDLQNALDSVFKHMDNTLSDLFGGGPNGPDQDPTPLVFIPSDDHWEDHWE